MINAVSCSMPGKILCTLFFIAAFFSAHSEPGKTEKLLVGIWQDSPIMASGWGEAYQFFSDGKFILNHNQMDCGKRELSLLGTWKIEDQHLLLEVKSRKVIKGGKEVEASASCASKLDIEGGEIVIESLKSPKKMKLKIGKIKPDPEYPQAGIKLGKHQYWKMREDPKDYQ
jgi:hypothetical protein